MAAHRTVTIVGDDTDGYTWACGTCGASGGPEFTFDVAFAAFTTHYTSAPSTPVDPWLLAVLNAGQQLANATTDGSGQAWSSAIAGAPADTIATWRGGGITHPQ
jgi:hypothetical protein